jgi:CO/xanthine dehydrogenase Mo-binding subunit
MPPVKYIGQNYQAQDLVAKVTGQAKYAEDFRAEGMLFCKLLLSPLPHARVRSMDLGAALAMPGVKAILTAEDMPAPTGPVTPGAERGLTNEPHYQGEPILAVAAVDELTAADAIERIKIQWEPLPFVCDPLESLRPNGPNARAEGNAWYPAPPAPAGSGRGEAQGRGDGARGRGPSPEGIARGDGPARGEGRGEGAARSEGRGGSGGPGAPEASIKSLKWTEQVFAEAGEGQLPMGEVPEQWAYGDVDAAFKEAALVVDETFVVQSTPHAPMEPRSSMAYWRNGKLFIHTSTQSTIRTVPGVAIASGIDQDDVVLISEYCGGGFGSKGGGPVWLTSIPALLSKKTNAPVMMRISREEEHFVGRSRTNMTGRVKVGFRKDGRITALDLFIVQDNGAYNSMGDFRSAGAAVSLIYQPLAMRWRGVSVYTNTPPHTQQRSPGPMQGNGMVEGAITKAAKQLGIDQLEIRRINSPEGRAPFGGPRPDGTRGVISSAFVKQALDRGAELFNWNERKARSGQRVGTKVRGVGVAVGPHGAGSIGFDGLMTIRPDGRLYVQSGVGNLGTHSVIDLARVAAEVLQMPWDRVEVIFGDTSKHLPWSPLSVGSQTTHAMTRANYAAALDAKRKLQEIAATDLGGSPEDYDVMDARVYRRGAPGSGLSYEQAARRALELGGRYDGHELPEDIHAVTKSAAMGLMGLGLMGVAKDNYPRNADATYSFVAGFAEVEVDVETGVTTLIDYVGVGDVGVVVNPRSLKCQILGGSLLGIGHALVQRVVYDQHYGAALARRFHYSKPLSILDVPPELTAEGIGIPDPETPVGARGVGEPPVGAGYGAVLNAIADAVGVEVFRRAPVTPDVILMSLEHGRRMHPKLTAHV